MGTVVFDFDSTLIDCESLDELLVRSLRDRPEAAAEVRAITNAGMEGRIPFAESLTRRLTLAQPTRAAAEGFGREALGRLTPGMADLVTGLEADVWIVSGGLREVLLPVAGHLGVPPERVLGTRVEWADDGSLARVAECRTKVEQLAPHAEGWARPRIMVGDGMTDVAPWKAGLLDRFIAFTAIVRREPVVATGAPEASSVSELGYLLAEWL